MWDACLIKLILICFRLTKRNQFWFRAIRKKLIWKRWMKKVASHITQINWKTAMNWRLDWTSQNWDLYKNIRIHMTTYDIWVYSIEDIHMLRVKCVLSYRRAFFSIGNVIDIIIINITYFPLWTNFFRICAHFEYRK